MKRELSQEISMHKEIQKQKNNERMQKMERWLVRKKKELSQKRKRQKSQNIIV